MSYLTWSHDAVRRQTEAGVQIIHICQAPVESLFVDDAGLLALTARGVERVPVPEEWGPR